jgi:hypothetical protein
MLDCSKYNKREGQSCDLNNLCRYPNCLQRTNKTTGLWMRIQRQVKLLKINFNRSFETWKNLL